MEEKLPILLEINNRAATLTLNRPEVRNALDQASVQSLSASFQSIEKDPNILMVILKGQGQDFCAGADLNWTKQSIHASPEENHHTEIFQKNGQQAVKISKKLIQQLAEKPQSIQTQMIHTANVMAEVRTSIEAQEGMSVFFEKRPPAWAKHE